MGLVNCACTEQAEMQLGSAGHSATSWAYGGGVPHVPGSEDAAHRARFPRRPQPPAATNQGVQLCFRKPKGSTGETQRKRSGGMLQAQLPRAPLLPGVRNWISVLSLV